MKITKIMLLVISVMLVALTCVFVLMHKENEMLVLDGTSLSIPCKFSEIEKIYDISEYSKDELKQTLSKGDSQTLFLSKEGVENGIFVEVYNNQKKATSDVASCEVRMISIDDNETVRAEVLDGLHPGMTTKEVEAVLENYHYNKSEMSGYVFYHVVTGKNDDYTITLVLYEDRVMNISMYYSNEES